MSESKLATIRKASGLSQNELANKAGLKVTTVQKWENRTMENAYVGLVKKAADALGCKVDDLI